ncbi:MAG: L-amino acid N-acetyltransferase AaaT [Candidatus Celerinatantimonas neptuna]|nr:MAG: L-amino acid N-acetyltransferase AaaT [Candidatus Celerinatantimonas neptuna]
MIKVRRATIDDSAELLQIYNCPEIYADTLQIPYSTQANWHKRLADNNAIHLMATIDENITGHMGIMLYRNPRRKHVASFGLAVIPEYHRQHALAI